MLTVHRLLLLLLASALALPALATDVSQTPLIVSAPASVKANVLFVLDDSGSMGFDYLPDDVYTAQCRNGGATSTNSGTFGVNCCQNGAGSSACWTGNAPFGTARGHAPFLAAGFNGMAYDPTIVYAPPVKADGSYWPSQTSANTNGWRSVKNDAYNVQNTSSIDLTTQFPDTEWCTDSSYTDCLRNDNYVLPGSVGGKSYTTFHATVATGTGSVASGAPDNPTTSARSFGPHYYNIVPAEYCTAIDLRICQATQDAAHPYPAKVRWCKDDATARSSQPADYACQAVRNGSFNSGRFPTKFFSAGSNGTAATPAKLSFTISVANCTTGKNAKTVAVRSLSVGGTDLFGGSSTSSASDATTLASYIVSNITNGGSSYTATRSGSTITITAPVAAGNLTSSATLTATSSSSCTFSPTNAGAFSGYVAAVPPVYGSYPGRFERVEITSGATYSRPSARTDCASIASTQTAGSCTYAEEMTNFANWWTYYHTRMQAMKSSASLAFGAVGNNRRVGYLSINNNTRSDFLNLGVFENTQRSNWFTKLTAARPSSSTPLRTALSTAGRLYAGTFNGSSLNGSTVVDPMEYSCQKNATILSTDGYWNESATPVKPDGTAIGDQDSSLPRPQLDGRSTSNTLADVAAYYYYNDLRNGTSGQGSCTSGSSTGADVCGTDDPQNATQRMLTFTLGLGVSGYMQFSKDYLSGGSPDFNSVFNGDAANPAAGRCSWQSAGGACNWPNPVSNTLTAVDDLWHAAVNGGGTYFSATNPQTLNEGLTSALQTFDGVDAAASAATTSNPNVTAGDNANFIAYFKSSEWIGEVQNRPIDLSTGKAQTTPAWSAQSLLDANTSRSIYMFSSSAASKLAPFDWSNISGGTQARYFGKSWIMAATGSGNTGPGLSQFCSGPAYCLTSTAQDAAAGEALVNFLRGDRSNEGSLSTAAKYFRARTHVLGDIANSQPAYMKRSLWHYSDQGYASFNSTSRQGMVYVGANDGMLHAFNADTGQEVWAYVPTAVIPNLYRLADKQYASQHHYFVDASPFVQDIKIGSEWRTVLIGGLGAGGRAYFALDVTDPASPKALWEFTNDNLGLTYGRPEVGKLSNGQWVVVVPSGYNNVNPGDGKGRLFVLDAATGVALSTIGNDSSPGIVTTAGSTGTPAGLGHIRAWVNNADVDNTIDRVYGADTLGNVWRFDVNNNYGTAGYDAQRLATLRDASGNAQPVTSRPELGLADGQALIFVGTGRYLGDSDLSDANRQSVYGIRDLLNTTDHGNPRTTTAYPFVQQSLVAGTCPSGVNWCKASDVVRVSGGTQAIDLTVNGGWYVDLPQSRERVNTDPTLVLGTLIVVSNVVDNGNVCKVGGSSWVNYFDYKTGAGVSVSLGNVMSSSATVYGVNGQVYGEVVHSNASSSSIQPPINNQTRPTRRLSWRDLLQQ
ncbi:MAG: hypothetical protein DI603_02830 [Roseateles depolymerans]|uniref:PilY1 beta-propeller domain-containing protein n=1 Tax=Roseateles depolymerans TaxID=76731 RepID=A0A2W5E3V1_9BURK|nr:MAG: hypothetical protein DI603_02830 [Roseateles depolymerans]